MLPEGSRFEVKENMDQKIRRAQLDVAGETREFALTHPSVHDYALLEELSFIRREAQVEANLAYADWRGLPCPERWTVYIAAQDRADAAQDALATWTRKTAPV
jgi:hypothetical protein